MARRTRWARAAFKCDCPKASSAFCRASSSKYSITRRYADGPRFCSATSPPFSFHFCHSPSANITQLTPAARPSSSSSSSSSCFSLQRETAANAGEFQLRCSFLEIHNEDIRDLLADDALDAHGHAHDADEKVVSIRESVRGEITVVGVEEQSVSSVDELMGCLEEGSMRRATGSTNMNSASSRSHAIFSIFLTQRRLVRGSSLASAATPGATAADGSSSSEGGASAASAPNPPPAPADSAPAAEPQWETIESKFRFVDLAGSERLKRTGAVGERMREGISINSGLLALGNVISALGDPKKKGQHVPFRDSKITRLLQVRAQSHHSPCFNELRTTGTFMISVFLFLVLS